jgi:hypothetical protein
VTDLLRQLPLVQSGVLPSQPLPTYTSALSTLTGNPNATLSTFGDSMDGKPQFDGTRATWQFLSSAGTELAKMGLFAGGAALLGAAVPPLGAAMLALAASPVGTILGGVGAITSGWGAWTSWSEGEAKKNKANTLLKTQPGTKDEAAALFRAAENDQGGGFGRHLVGFLTSILPMGMAARATSDKAVLNGELMPEVAQAIKNTEGFLGNNLHSLKEGLMSIFRPSSYQDLFQALKAAPQAKRPALAPATNATPTQPEVIQGELMPEVVPTAPKTMTATTQQAALPPADTPVDPPSPLALPPAKGRASSSALTVADDAGALTARTSTPAEDLPTMKTWANNPKHAEILAAMPWAEKYNKQLLWALNGIETASPKDAPKRIATATEALAKLERNLSGLAGFASNPENRGKVPLDLLNYIDELVQTTAAAKAKLEQVSQLTGLRIAKPQLDKLIRMAAKLEQDDLPTLAKKLANAKGPEQRQAVLTEMATLTQAAKQKINATLTELGDTIPAPLHAAIKDKLVAIERLGQEGHTLADTVWVKAVQEATLTGKKHPWSPSREQSLETGFTPFTTEQLQHTPWQCLGLALDRYKVLLTNTKSLGRQGKAFKASQQQVLKLIDQTMLPIANSTRGGGANGDRALLHHLTTLRQSVNTGDLSALNSPMVQPVNGLAGALAPLASSARQGMGTLQSKWQAVTGQGDLAPSSSTVALASIEPSPGGLTAGSRSGINPSSGLIAANSAVATGNIFNRSSDPSTTGNNPSNQAPAGQQGQQQQGQLPGQAQPQGPNQVQGQSIGTNEPEGDRPDKGYTVIAMGGVKFRVYKSKFPTVVSTEEYNKLSNNLRPYYTDKAIEPQNESPATPAVRVHQGQYPRKLPTTEP